MPDVFIDRHELFMTTNTALLEAKKAKDILKEVTPEMFQDHLDEIVAQVYRELTQRQIQ